MEGRKLSIEDASSLREMVSSMKEEQVWRTLEELVGRELELLDDERIRGDLDMRQATLWNAAAMISAAEKLITQVRTE